MPEIEMVINKADVDRLLRKLDPAKRDEVIMYSLTQSAIYIAGWIKDKRLTGPRPQFLGVISNRLRSSIGVYQAIKERNELKVRIGTNVDYARRHEYGDEKLGITHKKGKGIPPRPFMRPAVEDRANKQGVLNDLKRNINKLLET